jgi:Cu/Ag efflux protein CusF
MYSALICAGLYLLLSAAAPAQASPSWISGNPASASPVFQLIHEGHAGATKASGVVNSVDAAQRKVNVSHGQIKQLGWPPMTMDFPVSSDVDLTSITPGMKVNFTLIKGNGGAWTVDTLKPSGK